MKSQTTIAAISTPVAVGGIGMVRISGPRADEVAADVFCPAGGKRIQGLPGYHGLYGRVRDRDGDFDDAMAFVYRAPHSYTGEDVVEITCHGGIYLVQRLLRACLDAGAEMAQPGEFTRRAVLNGKLSLTQAEGVMDLIHAQGSQAGRAALAARDGVLFQTVSRLARELVIISSHLAAWIDYPEEDVQEVDPRRLYDQISGVQAGLDRLLATYDSGRILREGITTAIVGRPNVGKSTLMNLLSGYQRSIVSDLPGTTRDVVEDLVRVGDLVLHLADTAGLRHTDDPVEAIGVAMSWKKMENCDLILALFDASEPLNEQDYELLKALDGRPAIVVVNKTDLKQQADLEQLRRLADHLVLLSAQTGAGVDQLAEEIRHISGLAGLDASAPMIANERQRGCAVQARQHLQEAIDAIASGVTLDAVAVCVDAAIDALLSLTGERASEAVVDEVFSRFCVGK